MGLEFNDELPGVAEPPDILERRGVEALERIANMAEARELRSFVGDCEIMARRSEDQNAPKRVKEFLTRAGETMEARGALIEPLLSVPDQVAADNHADGAGDGGEAASLDLAAVLRATSEWGDETGQPVGDLLEKIEGVGSKGWARGAGTPPAGAASDLKHVLAELEAMTVEWAADWPGECRPVDDVVQLIRDMRAPNYAAKRTEAQT